MKTTRKMQHALIVVMAILIIGAVQSDTFAAVQKERNESRNSLYILSFGQELSDAQAAALERAGATVVAARGQGEVLVQTPNITGVNALPFVKNSRKMNAEAKLQGLPALAASPASTATMDVVVSLTKRGDYSDLRTAVSTIGGSMVSRGLLFGRRAVVRIPVGSAAELAAWDAVLAVEPAGRQKVVHNFLAAKSSKINNARNSYGLTGEGIVGGIWDEGMIDPHQDLVGQFEQVQGKKVSAHSTHVAGTIVGTGAGMEKARGMAPDAHLYSYDFNGDVPSEMAEAVRSNKILFANNSWSFSNGWSYHYILKLWIWWGDYFFGHYSSESAAYDDMIAETGLVVLFAAGNDRGEKGTTTEAYLDMTIGRGNTVPHGPDGPYRSIDVTGSAKNVITVGAVDAKGKMTSFSSWGPTKDGRVKPEIVADGSQVVSTVPGGGYEAYSGTSMATPAASGGIALLLEQYKRLTGDKASPALIRALLAASARDLGNPGPDYVYGFGLFDAYRAASLIEDSLEKDLIIEDSVTKAPANRTKYYRVNIEKGTSTLKIALAWIDPAAAPTAGPTLVNDLNLRIYRPDGSQEQLPFVLDPAAPEANATRGVNRIDNIELVNVDRPVAGEWIIEVSAARVSQGKSQAFALVVNSSDPIVSPVSEVKFRK